MSTLLHDSRADCGRPDRWPFSSLHKVKREIKLPWSLQRWWSIKPRRRCGRAMRTWDQRQAGRKGYRQVLRGADLWAWATKKNICFGSLTKFQPFPCIIYNRVSLGYSRLYLQEDKGNRCMGIHTDQEDSNLLWDSTDVHFKQSCCIAQTSDKKMATRWNPQSHWNMRRPE